MSSQQNIEELAGLFRQREKLDAQILVLLQLHSEPQQEQPQKKKRGRRKGWKPASIQPKLKEPRLFKCQDCGHEFMSKLSKLDVVCTNPNCESLNVDLVTAL